MPVMGGEETLLHIREIDDKVPVILLSGFEESEAMRRFGGRQAAAFLQKPFAFHQVLQLVGEVLES